MHAKAHSRRASRIPKFDLFNLWFLKLCSGIAYRFVYNITSDSGAMEAIVFVNCMLATTELVQQAARATQGVLAAYPTTGIYDLVLKVAAPNEQKLERIIQSVQSIQGVGATLTSIIRRKSHGNEVRSEDRDMT
jgi:DNA-binding Lrp family transcriptional regulator